VDKCKEHIFYQLKFTGELGHEYVMLIETEFNYDAKNIRVLNSLHNSIN